MQQINESNTFTMHNHLKNGDLIETGEKPILADIDKYDAFLKSCSSWASIQKKQPRLDFGGTYRMCELEAKDLGMSPEVYIHIQVLNAKLCLLKDSQVADKDIERLNMLKKTVPELLGKQEVEPVPLSKLIDNGLALCSECSIIAQAHLERQGIESYLCSAKLFQEASNGDVSYEKHHFLVINDHNRMFVYDPLNTKSTGRPRVMDTGLTKDEFIKKTNSKEGFILDFQPDVEKLTSRFDIGDTHHLGYGVIRGGRTNR